MGVLIRFNVDNFKSMMTKTDDAITKAEELISSLTNCSDMTISLDDERVYKTHEETKTDADGNEYTETITDYNHTTEAGNYNEALGSLSNFVKMYAETVKNKLSKYKQVLSDINSAIDAFEQESPSLESALNSLEGIDLSNWSFETVDGVEVAKYKFVDANGKVVEMTVAEMVNCAYTETSMSMSEVVMQGILNDGKPISVEDVNKITNDVNAFATQGAKSRAFGVASLKDINKVLNANGMTLSDYKTIENLFKETDPDLVNQINGVKSAGFAVGGLILGAYDLVNRAVEDDKKSAPSTGGGKPQQQPSQPQQPINTNDEIVTPSVPEPEPQPEPIIGEPAVYEPSNDIVITEPISEGEIPDIIDGGLDTDQLEKDYDELAREQYEQTPVEEIDEYRNEIINDINEKINNGEFDAIKEKLSEYGYSPEDIDKIIEDRDCCVNAILAGDQKQQLAKIANDLAKADGVEDFDTIYDDVPNYEDTMNGTDASLLAIMSNDETIVGIKEQIADVENSYNDAVKASNEAVQAAQDAKNQMNDIKQKYTSQFGTDDTSKWDASAASEYNDSINKYNDCVNNAKSLNENVKNIKEEYTKLNEDLKTAKEEFINNVKENNNRLEEPGEPVPGVLPPGDDSGTLPEDGLPIEELPIEAPIDDMPIYIKPIDDGPRIEPPGDTLPIEELPIEELPIEEFPISDMPITIDPVDDMPRIIPGDNLEDMPRIIPGDGYTIQPVEPIEFEPRIPVDGEIIENPIGGHVEPIDNMIRIPQDPTHKIPTLEDGTPLSNIYNGDQGESGTTIPVDGVSTPIPSVDTEIEEEIETLENDTQSNEFDDIIIEDTNTSFDGVVASDMVGLSTDDLLDQLQSEG